MGKIHAIKDYFWTTSGTGIEDCNLRTIFHVVECNIMLITLRLLQLAYMHIMFLIKAQYSGFYCNLWKLKHLKIVKELHGDLEKYANYF